MTITRLPSNTPDLLRAAGLKVVEIDGWQTRGRPASTGGFHPRGVLWHHTGSGDRDPDSLKDDREYAVWLAKTGRSDLPAPLCQLSVGRDGTVYVCAAGRANHAGKAKASGTMPAGDGNDLYVGVECQNNGTEGFAKPQYSAMVVLGVVLSRDIVHCGSQANRAHKETSVTGKWDPGALSMTRFRTDIAHGLTARKAPKMDHVDLALVQLNRMVASGSAALEELRKVSTTRAKARAEIVVLATALAGLRRLVGRLEKIQEKIR